MLKEQIKNLISEIVGKTDFSVEIPEEKSHGDYATNVALILAPRRGSGQSPMEIAEEIKLKIKSDLFKKIEIVPPGFINFFLKPEFLQSQIK